MALQSKADAYSSIEQMTQYKETNNFPFVSKEALPVTILKRYGWMKLRETFSWLRS